jgi:hypothetical protein
MFFFSTFVMGKEYGDSFYLLQSIYLFIYLLTYFGTFYNFQRIESHYDKMKKKNQDTSETKEDCLVLRLHNVMS